MDVLSNCIGEVSPIEQTNGHPTTRDSDTNIAYEGYRHSAVT